MPPTKRQRKINNIVLLLGVLQEEVKAHNYAEICRLLSIYDQADKIAGTCQELSDKAPGMTFQEEVLTVGRGQGTFFAPRAVWVDRVVAWAKGEDRPVTPG